MLKIPILKCLFLIGGGHQVNDQYCPATGKARAFRNGITLDGPPKNKEIRVYIVKLEIFLKKYYKTKSPWKRPLWTFWGNLNGTRWYVWMVLWDFCQKINTSQRRWPRYCGIAHLLLKHWIKPQCYNWRNGGNCTFVLWLLVTHLKLKWRKLSICPFSCKKRWWRREIFHYRCSITRS